MEGVCVALAKRLATAFAGAGVAVPSDIGQDFPTPLAFLTICKTHFDTNTFEIRTERSAVIVYWTAILDVHV